MKIILRYTAILLLFFTTLIACDKDFASIDSDLINNENATNFNISDVTFSDNIIAYTKKLNPVQTNGLPITSLGFYQDQNYGSTTYSFVTQVSSSLVDPDFGDDVQLDSVILTIPYFSRPIDVTTEGVTLYELDSIWGTAPFRLSIYESNYFLRDFDPNSDFDEPQKYYSNQSSSLTEQVLQSDLEGEEILLTPQSDDITDAFTPKATAIRLEDNEGNLTQSLAPALRLKLQNDYWEEKIFGVEGQPELSNANNFANYFRGLYFKAEPINNNGNLVQFDLSSAAANITLFYSKAPLTEDADRDQVTYVLNFNGNRVNFIENDFVINLENGDDVNGDTNLYIKGGEGSVAEIKLFNGDDLDDDNSELNSFEEFKSNFAEIDEDGKFIRQKRLINEANLVFVVDESFDLSEEKTRLFIYDAENNRPLIDFFTDTENSLIPFNSRIEHLGSLQINENEVGGEERVYKFNITQHLVNLITNDSTNVKLGLSVSSNVNLEEDVIQPAILTSPSTSDQVPLSSIISPRGTILAGSNHPDEDKRVFLEIFYSEPEND